MWLCRLLLIASVAVAGWLLVFVALRAPFLAFVLTLFALYRMGKTVGKRDSLGSAAWATTEDMAKAGMLSAGSGLVIGRVSGIRPKFWPSVRGLCDPRMPAADAIDRFILSLKKVQPKWCNQTVRLNNAVHTAVYAPTGSGKGVSIVIPFLLDCPDSCVVIDPKGENYRLTAEHRRAMGQRIIRLDPFGVCGPGSDTFNPLDGIEKDSPLLIDDCRDLAASLVVRTGEEKDPHWNDAAEQIITGLVAACCAYANGPDRSIQSVRTLLTDAARMQAMIALMAAEKGMGGLIARIGNQLASFKDKELASVMTTVNRHMNFLDTLAVVANTRASTFDSAILRREKVTAYLILPPERMASQAALLRMWIGGLMRACVRHGLSEENKVHYVLDECSSLGKLDVLVHAVDKYRGYGVRLLFIYQSLGQLKQCWKDGQDTTLLGNTTSVFFGVNDPETAQHISTRLGKQTVATHSGGGNSGRSSSVNTQDAGGNVGWSRGWSTGWNEAARELLTPDEVTQLNPRNAIVFAPATPPLLVYMSRYYERQFDGTLTRWGRLKHKAEAWLVSLLLLGATSMVALWVTRELPKHKQRPAHPVGHIRR